ncbi:MAG: DUF2007 domain-containing protein [Bacteroidetes bacterium]|nr:DUF2007 domain-containing protein [Bacteroidota bacterium]
MNDNWEKVYTSTFEHKVEIVKAVLENNDIESIILNKKDSFYLMGEIELYVSKDDVIRAITIIEKEEI